MTTTTQLSPRRFLAWFVASRATLVPGGDQGVDPTNSQAAGEELSMRRAVFAMVTGISVVAAGCSSQDNAGHRPGSPPTTSGGTSTTAPAHHRVAARASTTPVSKVLVFVVENKSFDQMRSQMPKVFALGQEFGVCRQLLCDHSSRLAQLHRHEQR